MKSNLKYQVSVSLLILSSFNLFSSASSASASSSGIIILAPSTAPDPVAIRRLYSTIKVSYSISDINPDSFPINSLVEMPSEKISVFAEEHIPTMRQDTGPASYRIVKDPKKDPYYEVRFMTSQQEHSFDYWYKNFKTKSEACRAALDILKGLFDPTVGSKDDNKAPWLKPIQIEHPFFGIGFKKDPTIYE